MRGPYIGRWLPIGVSCSLRRVHLAELTENEGEDSIRLFGDACHALENGMGK